MDETFSWLDAAPHDCALLEPRDDGLAFPFLLALQAGGFVEDCVALARSLEVSCLANVAANAQALSGALIGLQHERSRAYDEALTLLPRNEERLARTASSVDDSASPSGYSRPETREESPGYPNATPDSCARGGQERAPNPRAPSPGEGRPSRACNGATAQRRRTGMRALAPATRLGGGRTGSERNGNGNGNGFVRAATLQPDAHNGGASALVSSAADSRVRGGGDVGAVESGRPPVGDSSEQRGSSEPSLRSLSPIAAGAHASDMLTLPGAPLESHGTGWIAAFIDGEDNSSSEQNGTPPQAPDSLTESQAERVARRLSIQLLARPTTPAPLFQVPAAHRGGHTSDEAERLFLEAVSESRKHRLLGFYLLYRVWHDVYRRHCRSLKSCVRRGLISQYEYLMVTCMRTIMQGIPQDKHAEALGRIAAIDQPVSMVRYYSRHIARILRNGLQ